MLERESEFSREASAAALANLAANSEETQAAISAAGEEQVARGAVAVLTVVCRRVRQGCDWGHA